MLGAVGPAITSEGLALPQTWIADLKFWATTLRQQKEFALPNEQAGSLACILMILARTNCVY